MAFEEHSVEDFKRLTSVNFRGRVPRLQARRASSSRSRETAASSSTRPRWPAWSAGAARCTARPRARSPAHPGASPIEAAPFGIRVNAICPAGMPLTGFMAAGGRHVDADSRQRSPQPGSHAPARAGPSRPRTAPRPPCTCVGPGHQRHRACCSPSTVGTWPDDRTSDSSTWSGSASSSTCAATSNAGRWRLRRRPLSGLARAARAGAGPRRHGPRADRLRRRPSSSTGCPTPTGPTSRCSPRPPATPRTATPRSFASSAGGRRPRGAVSPVLPTACSPWAATSTAATGHWSSRRSCRPRRSGGSRIGSSHRRPAHRQRSRRTGGPSSTSTSARPSRSSPSPAASASPSTRPSTSERRSSEPRRIVEIIAPIVAARRE